MMFEIIGFIALMLIGILLVVAPILQVIIGYGFSGILYRGTQDLFPWIVIIALVCLGCYILHYGYNNSPFEIVKVVK